MKQRKYPYMIVGGSHLMIGMQGPDGSGIKASKRTSWYEVTTAQIDVIETTLDILEFQIDRLLAPKTNAQQFEEVFGGTNVQT